MPKTREQERAACAWKQVEEVLGEPNFKEYSQLLQGLPVMIHTAGLGQTVAFYRAKAKWEHLTVLDHLAAWLLRGKDDSTRDSLMLAITDGDSQSYRRLVAETHAYLTWLKRFADARNVDAA